MQPDGLGERGERLPDVALHDVDALLLMPVVGDPSAQAEQRRMGLLRRTIVGSQVRRVRYDEIATLSGLGVEQARLHLVHGGDHAPGVLDEATRAAERRELRE